MAVLRHVPPSERRQVAPAAPPPRRLRSGQRARYKCPRVSAGDGGKFLLAPAFDLKVRDLSECKFNT
ncbi:hypothetical protein EVAR_43364_1 [Eumeta japonica]|uniref:Uncharacterized protein n=1 Tax=Eumeta variegata TaxID=151549 RepID=A0A4C1WNW5_EUMVA|nr:hypothetical protein EVAR_43364_1 [Eumeta japonica]